MDNLYKHQTAALLAAERSLRNHEGVLVVLPTGSGKTRVFAEIARLQRELARLGPSKSVYEMIMERAKKSPDPRQKDFCWYFERELRGCIQCGLLDHNAVPGNGCYAFLVEVWGSWEAAEAAFQKAKKEKFAK